MKSISLHEKPGNQHGFSMLEVLITLFILSVGLLGLAATQAEGLKTSSGSLLRSKAVVAMADITDRMRANAAGLNNYSLTLGATISLPANSACVSSPCSATQMAQFDMAQWLQTLQAAGSGLPGAQAAIVPLGAAGSGRFAFTVSWTDRQERNETVATNKDEEYKTEVQF